MNATENTMIMVTDWEKVDKDDFYLTEEWEENGGKENVENARRLQQEGNLFEAYIVPAVSYAIYQQMDAGHIFIDEDGNEILSCESAIINNSHKHREEYSY
ncbi:unnamed protein product [marine sediment metagenome]|uniref:Uncharacterized protein n=1 Tax=marine sediment metagenome TaxID=412755 RepID=X1NAR5_9ZZZZ